MGSGGQHAPSPSPSPSLSSRRRPNLLFITADQLRADCLGCAGHPLVRTPAIDGLAKKGVRFAHHYNQAVPCGPSRNSLHTGMYLMNHRGVANGTPLSGRHTNWAMELRAQSDGEIEPRLAGYTDAPADPHGLELGHPHLQHWDGGYLPGLTNLLGEHTELGSAAWLEAEGFPAEVRPSGRGHDPRVCSCAHARGHESGCTGRWSRW
jgi:hypothetical protein